MDISPLFKDQMVSAWLKRMEDAGEQSQDVHKVINLAEIRQLDQVGEARRGSLVGSSLFMRNLREQIPRYAEQEGPLCIIGEKGVGKFHIASEMHYRSSRALFPLLRIDGANYRPDEWEAKVRKAESGTIIIEEADLFPKSLLQRMLQSAGMARIVLTGGTRPEISASVLEVIPLRDRAEDIPELVYDMLGKAGVAEPGSTISAEAMRMLAIHPYVGDNIDGLKRVVRQALVLCDGGTIGYMHLRFEGYREPGSKPVIGLALGSGSTRGAAHVGVLKVLEEADIPVDLITGSSVGAFIGALYVGGQPIAAFERVLPTVRWRQLLNPAWPSKGLVDNRKMTNFLAKFIGDVRFEDLPIPFAVVASDASSGEACILNECPVARAICASTAIPGIIKPVNIGDRQLIDGGVVHPVPVALARSMGADIVIAVDLRTSSYTKSQSENFLSTILNTIEIMSDKIVTEELQLADIVLHPQLEVNDVTFKSSAAYIQAGVKVTREAITEIKRKINAITGE